MMWLISITIYSKNRFSYFQKYQMQIQDSLPFLYQVHYGEVFEMLCSFSQHSSGKKYATFKILPRVINI